MLDVVHGIHGNKPDNCAELVNFASSGPSTKKETALNDETSVPDPDVASQGTPDSNWIPSMTDSPMSKEAGEAMPTPEVTKNEKDMPKPADTKQKCQASEVKCMSGENSPEYHECVYDRFLVRLCAPGTVCRTENGVAACGAPTSESASTKEMPSSQTEGSEMVAEFPEAVSAEAVTAEGIDEEVLEPSTDSAEPFPAPALVKGTEEMEGVSDLVKGSDEVEKPTFDIPEDFVGDTFGDLGGAETTFWPAAAATPTA